MRVALQVRFIFSFYRMTEYSTKVMIIFNDINICLYKKKDYWGVAWNKRREKWTVSICWESRRVVMSGFDNEIDAAKAYNIYIRKHDVPKPLNVFKCPRCPFSGLRETKGWVKI